ncbi:esterase [Siphonobacter sp. BAB-5385]|uniref:alpha/beta hydrolase n=1 Tax=Siphonobacter sp. BAB-5385 TaxID=1864822 RepID=UPI000B9ED78C|nr:alpha/beta hydrolase family protein [Siphonobacter sp. BAB-5385]OZI07860.1 esterase [Siphonobacter sp. BAB-5385]
MKKVLVLLLLSLSIQLHAQRGSLRESLSLSSTTLGRPVQYSLFLPEGYEAGNRKYPVLYLLHGFGDDETGWTQMGDVETIASQAMASGQVPPMIIVMPDAGKSWYVNSADGKNRYEDFFVNELIPHIDSTYRTRTDKQFRAIAGLSMGGYGTLLLASKHTELFSAAAPLSAAVFTDAEVVSMPEADWKRRFTNVYPTQQKGKERLSKDWNQNSIFKILETTSPDALKSVRFYVDCGDDDHLIKGNMSLHATMLDRNIPHQFRVRDGGHTWIYWRTALPEVLNFVSQGFH